MDELRARITPTPTSDVRVAFRGRDHDVLLKFEQFNSTGSVKDRTAAGLLIAMNWQSPITPDTVVVESTSGNLGLALAHLVGLIGCRLIAVIDPKTPEYTRRNLARPGVEVRLVEEPDGHGGYLLTRLRTVAELCRGNPDYRWSDQYGNHASPWIHRRTTGPEIVRQGGPDLDAVYVAVSTGGTLAGVSAHLRGVRSGARIVAVDSAGSLAFGCTSGPRLLTGIGSSRPSTFLGPDTFDQGCHVPDAEAIAMCRIFRADTGIAVGGSSGCVLAACVRDLASPLPPRRPLCLCPDSGDKYADTVYNDDWLRDRGADQDVARATEQLRADGLEFRNG
ncbi:MAG TPA: pyridoxal-phosphate dependent enzyme [Pseudonocardiaceae bacterium]